MDLNKRRFIETTTTRAEFVSTDDGRAMGFRVLRGGGKVAWWESEVFVYAPTAWEIM